MSAEPIVIYSHKIDPAGVLEALRRLDPQVQADGTGANWRNATISIRRGMFRKPLVLTFMHDPDYYGGADWSAQMNGMQGYFARFPLHDRQVPVMQTIASFRFALATSFTPDRSEAGYDDDPRMKFVYAVARQLDGAIFVPSALQDAEGRTLVAADGEQDEDAVFPQLPTGSAPVATITLPDDVGSTEEEEVRTPPSADRVAARALAMAAVCARGLLEQEEPAPDVEETRKGLLQWIDDIGVGNELEPDEWKVLQRPHKTLSRQEALNATWRLEGLGVLAWALNRHELLPIDELIQPPKLLPALGLLDADRAKLLLAEPPLRPLDELQAFADCMFALNWRMVNYRVKPEGMNFREFAKTAWFGPLEIEGVRLVNDDLAIGDQAIHQADPQRVQAASIAAVERHQAANWLVGHAPLYSKVETNT